MLILAGVSVTVALNGGLFDSAQNAKTKWELAQADEQTALDNYLEEIEKYGSTSITMLDGDGQTYYTLAPTALSFRSSANINDFQEVQVNGETIDPSNYTITEGSTIISLSIDYLKTLEEDDYNISIVSKTGSPNASFSVVKPKVNNHGFYYDQPYTAYVSSWGDYVAFVIREDGTFITISGTRNTSTCSYVIEDNVVTAFTEFNGTMTATISSDGKEIYCNELACTFELGNEAAVADGEYLYIFDNSLDGYRVGAIDDTKASYSSIRNNIYNMPTVSLASRMFEGNANLVVAPEIPISVTKIGSYAFAGCTNLGSITFEGTTEQWKQITLESDWNKDSAITTIKCSDGTVTL